MKICNGEEKKCMFVLSHIYPWIHPSLDPSVPFLLVVAFQNQLPTPVHFTPKYGSLFVVKTSLCFCTQQNEQTLKKINK